MTHAPFSTPLRNNLALFLNEASKVGEPNLHSLVDDLLDRHQALCNFLDVQDVHMFPYLSDVAEGNSHLLRFSKYEYHSSVSCVSTQDDLVCTGEHLLLFVCLTFFDKRFSLTRVFFHKWFLRLNRFFKIHIPSTSFFDIILPSTSFFDIHVSLSYTFLRHVCSPPF